MQRENQKLETEVWVAVYIIVYHYYTELAPILGVINIFSTEDEARNACNNFQEELEYDKDQQIVKANYFKQKIAL